MTLLTIGIDVHLRSETKGTNGDVSWNPKYEVFYWGFGGFLESFTEHGAHPRGRDGEGSKITLAFANATG